MRKRSQVGKYADVTEGDSPFQAPGTEPARDRRHDASSEDPPITDRAKGTEKRD